MKAGADLWGFEVFAQVNHDKWHQVSTTETVTCALNSQHPQNCPHVTNQTTTEPFLLLSFMVNDFRAVWLLFTIHDVRDWCCIKPSSSEAVYNPHTDWKYLHSATGNLAQVMPSPYESWDRLQLIPWPLAQELSGYRNWMVQMWH